MTMPPNQVDRFRQEMLDAGYEVVWYQSVANNYDGPEGKL